MAKDDPACPKCGERMNHHADKIDYGATASTAADRDPDFDGPVLLVYCCPACGESFAVPE